MPRLRILYVGTLPPHPGGSAILGAMLLGGLAARGHAIRAVAPTLEGESCADTFVVSGPGFPVERYPVSEFESSPDRFRSDEYRRAEGEAILKRFLPLAREFRPDVVIAGRETFAWHVVDLAAEFGVPCVVLVQGATTWGMLRGTMPRASTEHLLEKFRKASRVVAVARHLAARVRELGVREVATIPNSVDLELFSPGAPDPGVGTTLGIPEGTPVALHLSNLKPLKQPLDIVRSAELALRQEPRLVYVVAGEGLLRQSMQAAVEQAGIAKSFRFSGWVDHCRTVELYRLADVVLMPSAAEAMALVYLEAMACGRTLVASDVDGARELLCDGKNALLHAPGDVQRMAALTLRAIGDEALRERIGRFARATVERHDVRKAVAAYERLLFKAAQSVPGGRLT